MTTRLTRAAYTACVLLVCGSVQADEVAVSAKYQTVPGGYQYLVTLYNNTTAQPGLYVWALDAHVADASALEYPVGWDHSRLYSWRVTWAIADTMGPSGNWAEGVPPGGILSGFTVTAPSLVDEFYYQAFTQNGVGGPIYSGYAYPEPVPEPGGLAALAAGMGVLRLSMVRRRRAR